MRMACLSNSGCIFVTTHDSIGLGEDGPTHQPIEHLASFRIMPGNTMMRPGDGNETAAAYIVRPVPSPCSAAAASAPQRCLWCLGTHLWPWSWLPGCQLSQACAHAAIGVCCLRRSGEVSRQLQQLTHCAAGGHQELPRPDA